MTCSSRLDAVCDIVLTYGRSTEISVVKSKRVGQFEIFGIDIDQGIYDAEVFKELLQAALSDAKHRKGNVMTFFCDEEYEKVADAFDEYLDNCEFDEIVE